MSYNIGWKDAGRLSPCGGCPWHGRAREHAVLDFFASMADASAQEEERRADWRAARPSVLEARQQVRVLIARWYMGGGPRARA